MPNTSSPGSPDRSPRLSRRDALTGAAAVAVAAAVPSVASGATSGFSRATSARLKDLPSDLTRLGLLDAAANLRAKRFSAVELLDAYEMRIARVNGGAPTFSGSPDAINAFIRLYPEVARRQAVDADRRRARLGVRAPMLLGVPLALKDLYAVQGLSVTASSRMLEGNVAKQSSVMWERLERAGMVLLGHTHTHEFAAGTTTDQVGNPWDLKMTVGGSSGGSAAALAAHMVPAALGTDTGGSLRLPAAACGVSAIKPTRGRLPTGGVVPLAETLDHCGPMARTVADASLLLEAMAAGRSEVLAQAPPAGALGALPRGARRGPKPLRGTRIALTTRIDESTLHPDVARSYSEARKALERLGATVMQLESPTAPEAANHPPFFVPILTEVWEYHRQFAGKPRDLYRPAIGALIEQTMTTAKAEDYAAAQAQRNGLAAAWDRFLDEHRIDAVLEPTTPLPPRPRGANGLELPGGPEYTALVRHWNVTGHPVVALPTGLGERTKLPVGVSLIGSRGGEVALVQLAIDVQEHELAAPVAPIARS